MSIIPSTKYIKCSFEPDANSYLIPLSEIEVFYGITRELYSKRPDLKNYISKDEKLRADKFIIPKIEILISPLMAYFV